MRNLALPLPLFAGPPSSSGSFINPQGTPHSPQGDPRISFQVEDTVRGGITLGKLQNPPKESRGRASRS